MKQIIAVLAIVAPGAALAQGDLAISHPAARTVAVAPTQNFTGRAEVDMLFAPAALRRVSGGAVSFAPGARTNWHTHPLGQTLVVTAGVGRVQRWGGATQTIRAGDVVTIPPATKHWHGAAPDSPLTHIAIQEAKNGKTVRWLEPVTDAQYAGRSP